MSVLHPLNFYAGWSLVLAAFVTGAAIGLFFHREQFWGGYSSFRRRIVRLGHIALAALGMMNVIFAATVPCTAALHRAASLLMVIGGISMPLVCFLSGIRMSFRHLFFIPVLSLVAAVVLILLGGLP
jgi:hypothetical protein